MTIRRDKFATRTNPQPPLLKTGDIFDYNGKRYRVTSHSRWYCGAVRSYPPIPNLGRIVADEWNKLCEAQANYIRPISDVYKPCS